MLIFKGEKDNFVSWRLRKGRQNFCLENRRFFWKSEILSTGIENFCDRIHDPQTSNQIDAAGSNRMHTCIAYDKIWLQPYIAL